MDSALKVFDYINSLISLLPKPERFDKCNFSLLCDKYPIKLGNSMYLSRVLYVSLKTNNETLRFYPDKLNDMNLEYVKLKSTCRRQFNINMHEFFINGNTEKLEYKDTAYYNYSIEKTNIKTKDLIVKLRQKYNIKEPEVFIGVHQDLVLE